MGVLVIAMLLCSLYIWDHDRKLPKEEEYIYEPFKSEDVDFWMGKRAQAGKKVPKYFNKNLKFD